MSRQVVEADWTWTGNSFEAGIQLVIDEGGRIAALGPLGHTPSLRLENRALLPGFVNAHSHAFQRGLRGLGEVFGDGVGSFWTWREAMYRQVESLDEEALYGLCLQAYREMRAAGITAVGEFHYLHHHKGLDFALDEVVLEAARTAGLRLVLLQVYYRTGGVDKPLAGAQERFATPSPEAYWAQMDRLAGLLDSNLQRFGVVAHSFRAAEPREIAALAAEARRRGLVFHIHVEEQRREIKEVMRAYGLAPLALLNQAIQRPAHVTAVHCTHSRPAELHRFAAGGGNVCICPLTEANLGDGLAPLVEVPEVRDRLCLGTDSNCRISILEEMRWLEYGQRLASQERGALRDARGEVAPTLLRAATEGGARSLGLETGRLRPGSWADLVVLDLEAATLAGWTPPTLLPALIFGAAEEAIAATCVGGTWQGL